MKKCKVVIFITAILIIFTFSISFAASVKVQINGEIIDFTDSNGDKVEAQTINSRTMVPLRKIFEELGCTIEWDGNTKSITAKKDSKTIQMQIDNKEVSFTNSGKKESKTLDQPPIIKDNRTLVPLRFVSEALDMEVAWDSSNSTAIIIDYDYLADIFRNKLALLKNFNAVNKIQITSNYYDDITSSNNAKTNIVISSSSNNVSVGVDGTSEFAEDVVKEEWNDFSFTINDDNVLTSNYVFSKMLDIKKNENTSVDFSKFSLSKNKSENLKDYIKMVFAVENSTINVDTFSLMKSDVNKFIDCFLSNKTIDLTEDSFKYNYLDMNKLFDQRTENETFNTLLLLNKLLFRISASYEDVIEEYPTFSYTFSSNDNSVTIKFSLANEYKERFEYIFVISK